MGGKADIMNACDIIFKTRRKQPLSYDEMKWFIDGYVKGDIPDYQVSAWLMAVCFNSLTREETKNLTLIMRDSGETADLSDVGAVTADKHSTGGIGDKTSLVIAPVCAACGLHVPKMSGRGLGFTGGTIDKLESIPGFNVSIDFEKYVENIRTVGTAIISQSGNLVPADKKLYALRDVTSTVDSIPLICSSIMSKKLATGSDCILLDVKTGSGAFMKNTEDAKVLAQLMAEVGRDAGKKCRAVITDMNQPLGHAVGNALEVIEAVEILKGNQKDRLYELCMVLASNMLELAGLGSIENCRKATENAVENGSALEKFREMVEAQGGDSRFIDDYSLLPHAAHKLEIYAASDGYISEIYSEDIGFAALLTGAGRSTKGEQIDHSAGIIMNCETGQYVNKNDIVMTIYSGSPEKLKAAAERAEKSVKITPEKPEELPLVYDVI